MTLRLSVAECTTSTRIQRLFSWTGTVTSLDPEARDLYLPPGPVPFHGRPVGPPTLITGDGDNSLVSDVMFHRTHRRTGGLAVELEPSVKLEVGQSVSFIAETPQYSDIIVTASKETETQYRVDDGGTSRELKLWSQGDGPKPNLKHCLKLWLAAKSLPVAAWWLTSSGNICVDLRDEHAFKVGDVLTIEFASWHLVL